MGVFFYTHSVALAEDLSIGDNHTTIEEFYAEVDTSYQQVTILNFFQEILKQIVLKLFR